AAEKAREVAAFRGDRTHGREVRAQLLERVAPGVHAARAPALGPFDVGAASAKDRAGAAAEEAVAGPLLAALDRFEEEARLAVVEAPEERERRVVVGHDLAHDRHEIAASGEILEDFLGRAEHAGLAGDRPPRRKTKYFRVVIKRVRRRQAIRSPAGRPAARKGCAHRRRSPRGA